jgi:hypothetical protein
LGPGITAGAATVGKLAPFQILKFHFEEPFKSSLLFTGEEGCGETAEEMDPLSPTAFSEM